MSRPNGCTIILLYHLRYIAHVPLSLILITKINTPVNISCQNVCQVCSLNAQPGSTAVCNPACWQIEDVYKHQHAKANGLLKEAIHTCLHPTVLRTWRSYFSRIFQSQEILTSIFLFEIGNNFHSPHNTSSIVWFCNVSDLSYECFSYLDCIDIDVGLYITSIKSLK